MYQRPGGTIEYIMLFCRVCIKNLFTTFFFMQRYCYKQNINSHVMSNHKITAEETFEIIDDDNFGQSSCMEEHCDEDMAVCNINSSKL